MSDQVLIAAISAGGVLLGAGLTPILAIFTSRLESNSKRKEFLRSKYELMVDHLNASMKLLATIEINKLESFECALLARNAYSLSMIYFPKVHPYSSGFLATLYDLLQAYDGNDSDKLEESKMKFQIARGEFESAISRYAKHYT